MKRPEKEEWTMIIMSVVFPILFIVLTSLIMSGCENLIEAWV